MRAQATPAQMHYRLPESASSAGQQHRKGFHVDTLKVVGVGNSEQRQPREGGAMARQVRVREQALRFPLMRLEIEESIYRDQDIDLRKHDQ
jgi:hypothetical protein